MKKSRNGLSWKEASLLAVEVNHKKYQKRIEKYSLNPSICKFCKESLPYEKQKNKFCSHSCSASFNNSGKKRNEIHGKYSKKICPICRGETSNKKCCSKKCYGEYCKSIRRTWINDNGCLKDYKKDKWYLEETRGKKCETCGLDKWMNNDIPLDMDHKDGDSDNNDLNNVRLICPNCHRQTPNHGSKNNGKGRHSERKKYRRERYKLGLSY